MAPVRPQFRTLPPGKALGPPRSLRGESAAFESPLVVLPASCLPWSESASHPPRPQDCCRLQKITAVIRQVQTDPLAQELPEVLLCGADVTKQRSRGKACVAEFPDGLWLEAGAREHGHQRRFYQLDFVRQIAHDEARESEAEEKTRGLKSEVDLSQPEMLMN